MPVVNPIYTKWLPFLFLIFFLSRLKAQQTLTQDVLKIDSLTEQGIFLDKGWRWHAGDNPTWAMADFDDSKWEKINPFQDISTLQKLPQHGIGWLRIRFQIPTALKGKNISLSISQTGATELFLNSQFVIRNGIINTQKQVQQGGMYTYLPTANLSTDTIQVIAIRYAFTKESLHIQPESFLRLKLMSSKQGERLYVNNVISYLVSSTLWGIFLILGILQLSLYIIYPTQRAPLYLGLFLIMQAITHILGGGADKDSIAKLLAIKNVLMFNDITYLIFTIAITFSAFFYLLGIYEYFKQPKRIWFFTSALLTLATFPSYIFIANPTVAYFCVFILGFIVPWSEILRIGIIQTKHKQQKAKTFAIVHGILLLTFVLYTITIFSPPNSFTDFLLKHGGEGFFSVSFLGLALTISILLSQEQAVANKLLQKQLVDLEVLSQKTLAQEQEKQHILATQTETLEKQVEERTSQLKASQAQLVQKEKLASLGELTAGIAHEIQNPLNFVNNFSEVSAELVDELKEELSKGDIEEARFIADDLAQNLQKINHHGSRASSIVKGMLEHSRTGIGEQVSTDLNKLADEYLRLSYHGMKAKNKDFHADFEFIAEPTLPLVNVVPQEIGRVLLNLLNNAFYAVKNVKLPKVTVSTSQSGKQIIIQVRDNGTGIPDPIKAKIFQPFFTTKPTGEGTGLGLSLSYDIITKGHGGKLTVESTEGVGSEFIITLPVV